MMSMSMKSKMLKVFGYDNAQTRTSSYEAVPLHDVEAHDAIHTQRECEIAATEG